MLIHLNQTGLVVDIVPHLQFRHDLYQDEQDDKPSVRIRCVR
jgi:hypothetical protein